MPVRFGLTTGLMAALAIALVAVGCSNKEDPLDPRVIETVEMESGGTPIVEPPVPTVETVPVTSGSDEPPGTTASSDGAEVEMGVGTYCWTNLCVDKIGPITRGSLTVTSGADVRVVIPAGTPPLREVTVLAFPAANPQQLNDGSTAWQPDFDNSVSLLSERDEDEVRVDLVLEPGTYVLTVGMFFEAGDVQYGVLLEVQ